MTLKWVTSWAGGPSGTPAWLYTFEDLTTFESSKLRVYGHALLRELPLRNRSEIEKDLRIMRDIIIERIGKVVGRTETFVPQYIEGVGFRYVLKTVRSPGVNDNKFKN